MLDSTQKSIVIATALLPTAATTTTKTKLSAAATVPNIVDNIYATGGGAVVATSATKAITIPTTTTQTQTTTKSTNTTNSTKAKTIFNWLKSTTTPTAGTTPAPTPTATAKPIEIVVNNCNNNNKNNDTQNSLSAEDTVVACVSETAESRAKDNNSKGSTVNRAKTPDVIFRDFRGVQSLRHLWNKRISALASESRIRAFGQSRSDKLTKSYGCLLNATHSCEEHNNELPPATAAPALSRQQRAQSFHDCSELHARGAPEREIDLLHREKDNFYKYKTAEQAAKHRARETHFPAVKASGERGVPIHWLKRQDICGGTTKQPAGEGEEHFVTINQNAKMAIRDTLRNAKATTTQAAASATTANSSATTTTTAKALSAHTAVISERDGDVVDVCQVKTLAATTRSSSPCPSTCSSCDDCSTGCTLTAASSPSAKASSRKRATADDRTPAAETSAKRGDTDSLYTTATTTTTTTTGGRSANGAGGGVGSARRTSSSSSTSSASRKYSFKTHSRTYHHHRTTKMNSSSSSNNNAKENVGSTGGNAASTAGSGAGYSMVARLTQQFNEIIQKDKTLLEEVKRKNGVLMSRGGHVYKVLETSELTAKNVQFAANPATARNSSNVQRNIKKFECGAEKPKLPVQSLHVLRKRHEIVSHRKQLTKPTAMAAPMTVTTTTQNRQHLSLPLVQTAASATMLEVVTEEAKTPLEQEEKSVVDNATTVAADVLKAKTAEGTYHATENAAKAKVPEATSLETNETCEALLLRTDSGQPEVDASVVQQVPLSLSPQVQLLEQIAVTETTLTVQKSAATEEEEEEEEAERTVVDNAVLQIETLKRRAAAKAETVTESLQASVTVDDNCAANAASDEKLKQRKHKYAKIYEKFRFRSPFSAAADKKKNAMAQQPLQPPQPPQSLTVLQSNKQSFEPQMVIVEHMALPKSENVTFTPLEQEEEECVPPSEVSTTATASPEPEAKLLDALEAVDQRIKGFNAAAPIVLRENDDFEQLVLPNNSFIYQASTKQVCNNELLVTQAVNVTLVNSIEGEQMIMEQKELQQQAADALLMHSELDYSIMSTKVDNQSCPKNEKEEEDDEDAMYEPIETATTPETKTDNTETSTTTLTTTAMTSSVFIMEEDIYQTLEEATANRSANLGDDYESIAGSCEQALPPTTPPCRSALPSLSSYFDGYEICEPPTTDNTAAQPASQNTTPTNHNNTSFNNTIGRNSNDELPELPKPKRRLPKSPMPGKRSPTKTAVRDPPAPAANTLSNMLHLLDEDNDDHHYYADDENIYDTIKGGSSHCYESLHAESVRVPLQKCTKPASSDTVSLTSNGYESITQYRRMAGNGVGHATGSSSGSTLTISSDHKTNSLYEMSLAANLLYGGGFSASVAGSNTNSHNSSGSGTIAGAGSDSDVRGRFYCHSIAASSDNSDAWIDISDAEVDGDNGQAVKQQFIVVRERTKVHRSPDWSKRIRDKRLQQKKAISCIEDDSDHYYESLSPLGNKRHSTQLVQRANSHSKRNRELLGEGATRCSKQYSASAHVLTTGVSDDYDSFDTDTDEIYETEEHLKNQNDSGVDMRHVKLPDPPPSANQVYASIVRKFKNFISNKKPPSGGMAGSGSKLDGSQQKLYENGSKFYVECNVYENTPKSKSIFQKSNKKLPPAPKIPLSSSHDPYENTEFHTPPAVVESAVKQLSASERNLSVQTASSTEQLGSTTTLRNKSKVSKSFKARLRKSLGGGGGSSAENKQLSLLTPTRSTFYIEDPSHSGSGELDSGFSEKASSGDLPMVKATTVPMPEAQKFSTVARKAKKEAKLASTQRRRTTIGIRPHEPPPPPPGEDVTLRATQQQSINGGTTTTTTSWYAECGVFKHGTNRDYSLDEHSLSGSKSTHSQSGSLITNGNSWYAEAGLYQTSGISVASSSGSSGVSTGNEGGPGDDMPHSMFLNEPLYQIYSAEKLQSISRDMEDHDGSTDGYEEVGQHRLSTAGEESQRRSQRPTALQLVGPKNSPSRTLWSEIPEVINSCILPTLTPRERGLQEAKFEIITSEASYLKSLNLLRSHFMNHPLFRDTTMVSARDRKALFAYIVPVHECSERLLTELESCWQDNIMLLGLSRRIYSVAEKYFHVYIAFCEHQGRMDRTLRRLKEAKGLCSQNLDLLEASPTCCGLNLHSFLMLPMQRITRLPLLIDAVFSKVSPHDDEYESWKMTLAIMNKIVTQCNEAANRCEQAYEIERISRQLEFPQSVRALAIAPVGVPAPGSKPRFLVKKGELTHLIWRGDDAKLTFGKKFIKSNIYAFLFSDLLVLSKRKAQEHYHVFDYCPRSMLTLTSGDALPQLPTKDINQTGKNLILMTLLENHERKTVELVLSCPSVSEQERWLQATRPPEPETPGEKLYEQWDCPQVIAKHTYEAKEPDVLNLEVGDVVNVTRKLPDGWYQGERIRDGAVGWFPGSYSEEVNSAHVRARNLKQRHRLLTFTATYLESQKRK